MAISLSLFVGNFDMLYCRCAATIARVLSLVAVFPIQQAGASQPAGSSAAEITTYLPDSFSRYAPKTALELVERLPGFTLKRDSSGQRGLGQAQGNVLINGQRIASKGSGATVVLRRLPVDNVVRLEVFDGSSSAIPGLSGQVVNVVVTGDSLSGTFSWSPRLDQGDKAMVTEGELSVSGKQGRFNYSVGIEATGYIRGKDGIEQLYDNAGMLIEHRDIHRGDEYTDPNLNGRISYESETGSVFNVSAQYLRRFNDDREIFDAFRSPADSSPLLRRSFSRSERERSGELGLDYEFDLGAGRLKLIALHRFEYSPFKSINRVEFSDTRPDRQTRLFTVQDEAEYIVRSEYSWLSGESQNWQVSVEAAQNALDARSRFERIAPDGAVTGIPLSNANSSIEEDRREISISHGRSLADGLSAQFSLGVEQSEISQTGAVGQTRRFTRPKGFASVAWRLDEQWVLNARLERQVGQLDFFDFVASVNLDEDTANAGNPDLVPPQTWLIELGATVNLDNIGVIDFRAYRELITDIVDQIPVGDDGETTGNIDSADRYGLSVASTLYLDRMGLKGVRVNFEGDYLISKVADPLTGVVRPISGDDLTELELELRHDIPGTRYAWGVGIEREWEADNVRLDQISSTDDRAQLNLFIERKDLFGMTVSVELQDLLKRSIVNNRWLYQQRRTGPLEFREQTKLTDGYGLILSVRGDF